DVAPVDAHAEGDGRRHDVDLFGGEAVLRLPALPGLHASVIVRRTDAAGSEMRGHVFGVAAREAIDDRRFAVMPVQGVTHLGAYVDARHDPVDEVRSIEPADEDSRLDEPELGDDVFPHALGGGRRVRVKARVWQALAKRGELAVLRPEVVTPLADAVRLVDREALDAEPRDELEEAR